MELVDTTSKTMMRPANAICLVAFIVVVAFTTTQTQAAEAGGAAAAPGPASPAAVEFLRGRCNPGVMPQVVADYCYDSLLPQAGAFNGSCIRVIGAATELMVAKFQTFLAELRKLDGAKYKVGKCVDQAAGFAGGDGKPEPAKLARVRALAADGDDNKVEYTYDIASWMNDVDVGFEEGCMAEMKDIPDADKLLPTNKDVYYSILVAHGLVSGFTPPGSTM